ncbi:MAG: FlgD immunoglobulin-like domain containing protein, partial [Candidatus Latescibacterota bacterium]
GALCPLQLHVHGAPEMSGWSVVLEYDPQELRYVPDTFQAAGFLPGLVTLVDDQPGRLSVGGAVLGTGWYSWGEGTLGTVTFEALGPDTSRTEVRAGQFTARLAFETPSRVPVEATAALVPDSEPQMALDWDAGPGDQGLRVLEGVWPGRACPLEVRVQGAGDVAGWSVTLAYDPDEVEYMPGTFQASQFVPGLVTLVDDQPGRLSVGGSRLGPGATGTGTASLGTLHLQATEGFTGPAAVRLETCSLRLADGAVLRLAAGQQVLLRRYLAGPTQVADGAAGPLPTTTHLLPPCPNPCNAETVVGFDLAETTPVRLCVFDIQGQRVRALANGVLPAGRHSRTWDGRNQGGRPVASGIYLVSLRAGSGRQVVRAALVR